MRLRSLLPVRPGEGRLIALMAALFAVTEMGRGTAEVAADTLFLTGIGADALPAMYVVLGLVGLLVVLGYGAAVGRFPRRRFLVSVLVAVACILVIERLALVTDSRVMLPVMWLSVQVMGSLLLTVLWTIAGTTLDARQAKRLFPLCTGAAIAGAFVGTLLSGPIASLVGVDDLLVIAGAFMAVAAGLTAIVLGDAPPMPSARADRSVRDDVLAGYRDVKHSPLLRLVAVAYVLFAILLFSVSFPFLGAVKASVDSEVELATVLGLLSAAVTATAFVLAVAIANRVYARIGVAGAALILPVVYVAGFGVWLVSFGLLTALLFRFLQQVTQRGLSNAAWSAMFNVVPVETRPQVLAFMDGVPGQLGTSLSGVLLLVVTAWFAPTDVFLLGLAAAALCVVVVTSIRRRYGEALLASLRAGLGEQVLSAGPGMVALDRDPQVWTQLQAAMRSPTPAGRRLAVDLIGRRGDPGAVELLLGALDDDDAVVRATAIRALGAADAAWATDGPVSATLGGLRADPDPSVRSELAIGLANHDQPDEARELAMLLLNATAVEDRVAGLHAVAGGAIVVDADVIHAAETDASPEVRAAALGAEMAIDDPEAALRSHLAALDDDASVVRAAAAAGLRGMPGSGPHVVAILESGTHRAQAAALSALGDLDDAVVATVRAWSTAQVDRLDMLRHLHAALLADRASELPEIGLLLAILERREQDGMDLLLLAAAALGSPEASGSIRRALGSGDRDARAQAIEAIDTIGDRRLGGAIVRLIETSPSAEGVGPTAALGVLRRDPDRWVRAMATRAAAARLTTDWQQLMTEAAKDADPLVRDSITTSYEGGPAMPETSRTLDDIDRMLLLRGVPLFAQLAPEDLHRLAASATERFVPVGEALVREGERGDELMVIVSGDVRVERIDGPGVRVLRSYQAGDHIGELAVLTERTRAATVIAEHDVRCLVLSGAGLRAILQERPAAAMAMLATLAGRIAAQ